MNKRLSIILSVIVVGLLVLTSPVVLAVTGEEILDEAADLINEKGIPIKKELYEGDPADIICEIAEKEGYDVKKRELPLEAFYESDEAFITSTHREILPVIQVNDKKIGSGKPGEATKKLMNKFKEEAK